MVNGRTRTVEEEGLLAMLPNGYPKLKAQYEVCVHTCDSDRGSIRVHLGLWMPAALCENTKTSKRPSNEAERRVDRAITLSAVPVNNWILEKIESVKRSPPRSTVRMSEIAVAASRRASEGVELRERSEGNDVAGSGWPVDGSLACNFSSCHWYTHIYYFGQTQFP